MSAIEALRVQVEVEAETREMVAKQEAKQKLDQAQQYWASRLGEDVLEELGAEYCVNGDVELRYRGKVARVRAKWRTDVRQTVLEWVDQVDAWHEEREENRVQVMETLREELAQERPEQTIFNVRAPIRKYDLLEIEEVRELMSALERWVQEEQQRANEAEQEMAEVLQREKAQRKEILLGLIRAATTLEEWHSIRESEAFREFVSGSYGMGIDYDLDEVVGDLLDRIREGAAELLVLHAVDTNVQTREN